ncbi:COX15/CtaA family protein [soil metagenome]
MNTITTFTRLSLLAVVLAFVVVVLGAFTRLTDAGLGCPDWPGCYHHLIVPHSAASQQQAASHYPQYPLEVGKAWTEMVHRYVAGSLGILILALAAMSLWQRKKGVFSVIPLFLVALVIFQALLGMWTVTLRLLPVIVMLHLLGGLSILALLEWLYLKMEYGNKARNDCRVQLATPLANTSGAASRTLQSVNPFVLRRRANPSILSPELIEGSKDVSKDVAISRTLHWLGILALVTLVIQIVLGGWTSSNYAALVCPDFPYCQAQQFFPQADFFTAFNPLSSSHSIENGHVLNHAALIVIHMSHRIGALITTIIIVGLSIGLLCGVKEAKLRRLGAIVLALLGFQIGLGILNVIWLLPLPIAVAHNAVAALLLLTVVAINFFIFNYARNQ